MCEIIWMVAQCQKLHSFFNWILFFAVAFNSGDSFKVCHVTLAVCAGRIWSHFFLRVPLDFLQCNEHTSFVVVHSVVLSVRQEPGENDQTSSFLVNAVLCLILARSCKYIQRDGGREGE